MSRSKAASGRSPTPTPCSPTSGAATAASPRSRRAQIDEQLALAVDRVMSEGSLYDREIAALAIKQARGDLIEAIFLAARLSHHPAALRLRRAARHRGDGAAPPRLGDLQGPARRPGARADLRLHPPADRLRARESGRSAAAGDRARPTPAPPTPRVADIIAGDDLIEREPAGRAPARRSPTSPATRPTSPPRATRGCRRWRAATKASCSASAIRPSAATAATIRSSARSASARSRSRCSSPSSASPFRSGRSPSPNARWSTSSRAATASRRASPAATASSSARASARRCRWRWSTARCAPTNSPKSGSARRRTRNSCSRIRDNVQATGFVEHLKLPHYVDFQAELALLRAVADGTKTAQRRPSPTRGGRRMTARPLQLRLSRRADEADDPPRDPQGDRHSRLSGSLRLARNADALRLGHRRRAGHRGDHRSRRRAQGDRPGRRRHHQRRLDPRLLRQDRRRRDDDRHDARRRSSRPATASPRRR